MKNASANTGLGLTTILLLVMPLPLASQDFDVRGQASAVLGGNDAPDPQLRSSLRYIVSLFLNVPVGETPTLDSELALNLFGSASVVREQRPVTEHSLDLYPVHGQNDPDLGAHAPPVRYGIRSLVPGSS